MGLRSIRTRHPGSNSRTGRPAAGAGGSEAVRVPAAEEEAVSRAVPAAQALRARRARDSGVLPSRPVAEHAGAREDRRVAVAGDAGTAGRLHPEAVPPVQVTAVRSARAGTKATADVAAEVGRRAEPARVDAADVPGRGPERDHRVGARRGDDRRASEGRDEQQGKRTASKLHMRTKSRYGRDARELAKQ